MTKCIAIIAPSFEGDGDSPQKAQAFLERHGWRVKSYLPPNNHAVFAAPQEERVESFLKAANDPDVDILWAIRGGGGSTLLIPDLLKAPNPIPKILLGFSDITSLDFFTHKHWGWTAVHSPTLKSIERTDPESVRLLIELINQGNVSWKTPLTPLNKAAHQAQDIQAPLVGGNLSLMNLSIGTFWALDLKDKVLLLEDIGEPPYRLALKLDHLRQSNALDGLKALLLGDFTANPDEEIDEKLVQLVINEFAHKLAIPVFSGVPVGHGDQNHPFAQGSKAHITTDANPYLDLEAMLP